MNDYDWIIDERGRVRPATSEDEFRSFMMTGLRQVERTRLRRWGDVAEVSTVFRASDHRFPLGSGPPLLFETAVSGGDDFPGGWEPVSRSTTLAEAKAKHLDVVQQLEEQGFVR